MPKVYTGRTIIYTDKESITAENIKEVLDDVKSIQNVNESEIDYLYKYYKGEQEIQSKEKVTRPEINNKITVNRAHEIVTFKTGYSFGEPVQYISRGQEEETIKNINVLNDYMLDCDKATLDSGLAEWFFICGIGYRIVLPNKEAKDDESPFKIRNLDPRYTFLVRYNDLDQEVAMGVTYVTDEKSKTTTYYCYTKDHYYEIDSTEGVKHEEQHFLGYVPIVEYIHNNARMGAFEPVLPLLDAINAVQSNRMDDIVQHVNAIMAIFGAELGEDEYKKLSEFKLLNMPDGSDVKYISATLNQNDVQALIDDLYKMILTICGMPNRNETSSGDNGIGVQLRDGWELAESQAKAVDKTFARSERQMLRVVFKLLESKSKIKLKLKNIDIKPSRRYADNILTKVQALVSLLDGGIDPEVAIATSGIWNDPTEVYLKSKKNLEKWSIEEDVLPPLGQKIDETQKTIEEGI